ncbi:glutaminyl-peptide cyclotransferase [Chryseobacterium aquaticum]|uniref:Glutamine cyclotransferase n=1 Tax=Chryseobacterium aquaticum subsp. greenlandense TaxID=345663 RepID=A0A117KBB2_9FLAO|nr:glutaminyl-peptide cyclotransferase [Chryseobacterium aquaticum]KUJ55736.1 glutamine cyclotransferase [Chryseobacterium aquaticum subsp. greenlandense]
MKNSFIIGFASILLLFSCKKDEVILNSLAEYNNMMEQKGYHFGDQLILPNEITDNAEKISVSFGDKETEKLIVDPQYFGFGENKVTFTIKTEGGETLNQDATINVFTKTPEKNISYKIIAEYPHNTNNFVEGFLMDGGMIYESDGLAGSSQLIKYKLGSTEPLLVEKQSAEVFSEGCAIAGDKIFQLTYQNRIGFIYDKNTFKKTSEFPLPSSMVEGWGLTFDGKNLVATDGTNKLYFLDVNDPSKVVKTLSVGGHKDIYNKLNEVEFYKGFIYANVWYQPIILKINPKTGETVGRFDFTKITAENSKDNAEKVLNGIAFKENNMLVTGKNWAKIYEVAIN